MSDSGDMTVKTEGATVADDVDDAAMSAGQVFDFRKPEDPLRRVPYELKQTVFIVGFMGAGKTSVARKLARNAGVASIDTDTYIERRFDCKIKELFAQEGEEVFRALEADILRELAAQEPQVVSCGGGVVLSEENRAILKSPENFVLYLQVTATEAASRISDIASRPLFGDLDQAQRVNDERLPLYEEVADAIIDTAGKGSGYIAREADALLKKRGVLWQRK